MKIFEDEFLAHKRINTLPFRSHYIPFDKSDKPLYFHGATIKESSSKVISLNGLWNFKDYLKKEDFSNLDYLFNDKEIIEVPSCVQMKGYDHIQYLNCRYPFPFNYPYIDLDNPLFHYQKKINLHLKDKYYLVFEGVDNAFYLFVNNQKVGYSLIAHSKSEFDITKYLKEGENKIDVLVLKWSASSYFECQDKFRFSGIFRDVYLLNRKEKHIFDYRIFTRYEKEVGYIDFLNKSEVDISINLLDKTYIAKPLEELTIKINNPNIWSDSNPYLYLLTLSYEDEVIYEYVGIRNVSIENGIFKINNSPFKFKGVNRHESHPEKGMTVSIEDTYKDLVLMKELNINGIRTSHYPDIPEFYELCNHIGLYVLDEADVETHGASQYRDNECNTKDWEDFASLEINKAPILDREISLFERDKNKTCVVIFSLGNESSYGPMFYPGLDYLKKYSDRPIHYEGNWCTTQYDKYYFDSRIDFASRMYPSPKELKEKHLDDPRETRPIIMCEYSHAMGNSNGDLRDYWELFNSSPRFCGGFIWEWCDHAVLVDGKLHYGGDDNDLDNDHNFCVDGLVTPYRELKSNTLEAKAIYGGKLIPDKPINKCKGIKPNYNDKKLKILFDDSSISISQIYLEDKPLLKNGLHLNFLRAPLDNDDKEVNYSFKIIKESKLIIDSFIDINDVKRYYAHLDNNGPIIALAVAFAVNKNSLEISYQYSILREDILFPRIGFSFELNDPICEFTFFGYGPDESYIDKCVHNQMGEFNIKVKDNFPSYNLKPQESGSHYYTSYIYSNNVDILASSPFSFSILPYDINQLTNTKHNYELPSSNRSIFSIDLAMAGVGTNSCGPRLDKKYWPKESGQNTFKLIFK